MPPEGVLSMRPDIPAASALKCSIYPANKRTRFLVNGFFSCIETPPGLRSLGRLFDAGLLLKAETPAELASKLGINAKGLTQTIRECNALAAGEEDAFGRVLPQPIEGPYYGIKVTVALYHTQGGLKVNAGGQVIRADGSIIPNLYAGGAVAVGVSGKGLEGYLPGNGLLASLGLGMIAAEHAVANRY
jgi:hypothetical protein